MSNFFRTLSYQFTIKRGYPALREGLGKKSPAIFMVGLSEKQGTGRESDVDSDGAADGGRHFAHFGPQLAALPQR